jgi:preprotein translocase subunit SecA
MLKIFSKFLDVNQKEVDRLAKIVIEINSYEEKVKKLKDKDFPKKTEEFKKSIKNDSDLREILPQAFAVAREASWRKLGLRPYDVQLMASIALFEGKTVEQKTGEGKTLSAVPALYLRALMGKGSHLVTVNDYLARRDAGWNAPVFEMLGLTTGAIVQEMKSFVYDSTYNDTSHGDERLSHLKPSERRQAYATDITYGTNNEFGFDYLRDNMVQSLDQMVQRGHYYTIVDEVDSVLIDEARTPLIISAPDTEPTQKYYKFADLIKNLNSDTDYDIDEKARSATLTEHGIKRVEKVLGIDNLYEKDWDSIHHIENALRARTLYLKDRDYVIKDDQVIIVDEFTGRLMVGRRWSDGLHQAVEAKEGVQIQQESKTLATISFQNYFRMYEHLAGMTGTASTEAEEFKKIYDLDVVVIPTNRANIRKDNSDVIYKSLRAKYGAIVSEIDKRSNNGQPVLVGTTSIEKNEIISSYLKKKKVPHNVLNAKNHESEAVIISEAGKPGSVTVATNMAGRGVDIVLGGAPPDKKDDEDDKRYKATKEYKAWQERHDKVIKAGGLHVIGTERHESRRIDNQLRGRSGRQGDPGSTRFYLSLEDDLMRIFGGEQIGSLMDRLNLPEDQPIENRLVNRAIEQAQVKVEGFHFDTRKNLVEYDDVANQQREIIYRLRRRVLEANDLSIEIKEKLFHRMDNAVLMATNAEDGKLEIEKLIVEMLDTLPFDSASMDRVKSEVENQGGDEEKIKELLRKVIEDVYKGRATQVGEQAMHQVEKYAYLGSIDSKWIDHIDHIDGLREGVRLRGYAQRDPIAEFKNEAYGLFETLLDRIDEELSRRIFRISVSRMPAPEIPLEEATTNVDTSDQQGLVDIATPELGAEKGEPAFAGKAEPHSFSGGQIQPSAQASNGSKKLGRNDPCWCGSGKKWKKCHYPQSA